MLTFQQHLRIALNAFQLCTCFASNGGLGTGIMFLFLTSIFTIHVYTFMVPVCGRRKTALRTCYKAHSSRVSRLSAFLLDARGGCNL